MRPPEQNLKRKDCFLPRKGVEIRALEVAYIFLKFLKNSVLFNSKIRVFSILANLKLLKIYGRNLFLPRNSVVLVTKFGRYWEPSFIGRKI